MTSIVSIVIAFMATFVLVFGYLSYTEQEDALPETDMPAAEMLEPER
jgi:hypothetical protein